ncbi:nucleotide-sugar transporter-domain-containing protein [Trametes punicea]|nr:nucleotide-sugar transporter-domain-containing protein [Trametes punicea]
MSQHREYAVLPQHAGHLVNDSREQHGGVVYEKEQLDLSSDTQSAVPSICGMPLKYVSLVTLAVQNALLTLIMHYSRVSAAPSRTYSAASAVLLTELLKGSISLTVAFLRLDYCSPSMPSGSSLWNPRVLLYRFRRLGKEVFRPDCWKLSIPAILYVIQNNLQFVAVSNLEAATFQVSYQMKILTTAAFSVVLLRKRLTPTKWLALLFLAIGVGIVQIQNGSSSGHFSGSAHDMNAFKGFMAVVMACFTSGLAGVYFEMVLKNSQADLWVRNVQLSLFSLLPALVPIVFSDASPARPSPGWLQQLFANFGPWAWATVLIQVLGGLLTALVIKYADNILKGFATSLSIVISFLASVALFNFQMTLTFVLGSTIVLVATWMYNQPDAPAGDNFYSKEPPSSGWGWHWRRPGLGARATSALELATSNIAMAVSRRSSTSSLSSLASPAPGMGASKSYPGSPIEREAPFFPQLLEKNLLGKRKEDDPAPFFPIPLRASRAASRFAHYLTRTGSGSFVFSDGAGVSYLPSHVSPSASYPSTRPPSALSSRPASAMGGAGSASLGTLPKLSQDGVHHS